ncbi:MAG: ribosomal large subunit pseudouridine synthase A-like protein [Nevskia sp.]|nr:ribosomal large subunit pseudouridine synthase A-like protein [Nevskia sp.]
MKAPLPVLDGVGPSTVLLPAGSWETVLDFLQARFPDVGSAVWQARMQRAQVVDAAGQPIDPQTPYRAGACVYYYREIQHEPSIPFEAEVIYRDEHLLVADKPHFLPVIPSGRFLHETLLVRLKKQYGLDDLVPLHRIDRGTAGIVLFSTNAATRGLYQSLFPRREVGKHYEALAPSLPQLEFPLVRRSRMVEGTPFFRMREVAGAPNSETHIDVLERRGALNLYALNPITGKKHQLRVHLAALGAAIVNDSFYPDSLPDAADDFTKPLKLLARTLAFTDPLTLKPLQFESRRSL